MLTKEKLKRLLDLKRQKQRERERERAQKRGKPRKRLLTVKKLMVTRGEMGGGMVK